MLEESAYGVERGCPRDQDLGCPRDQDSGVRRLETLDFHYKTFSAL